MTVTPEFMARLIELAITGLITGALLLAEHVALWRRIGPPWTYMVGTISLTAPFFILMARWGYGWPIAAWGMLVFLGGGTVLAGYVARALLGHNHLEAEIKKAFNLAHELIIKARRGGEDDEGKGLS